MANLVHEATAGVGRLLSFLTGVHDDLEDARALVNLLGWDLPPGLEDIGLAALDLGDFVEKLEAVLDAPDAEWEDELAMAGRIADLALAINSLVQAIRALAEALPTTLGGFGDYVDRTQIHKQLPRRLFDFLLINYAAGRSPLGYAVLHLLDIFDYPHFEADPAIFQVEHVRATVNYHLLKTLVTDPGQLATEAYGWNTPEFQALTFLQRLSLLFQVLGLRNRVQPLDPDAEAAWLGSAGPAAEPASQLITFLFEERGSVAGVRLGLSIFGARPTADGASDGGLGLVPIVRGQADGSLPFFRFEDTFIDLSADADVLKRMALVLRPGQALQVRNAQNLDAAVTGRFALGLRHGSPEGDRKTLLSLPGGAGLQAQQVHLLGGLEKYSDRPAESFMELAVLGGRFAFSLAEADDFLKEGVGQQNVEATFDFRVGWTQAQGIFFQGSSGLIVSLPAHAGLGAFTLSSVTLGLNVEPEGLALESSVTGSLTLGPLLVTIQRLGLTLDVAFGGGNLGVLGLAPRFKAPSALGLAIDGGGFKGGGFLGFDPDLAQYSGMLELEYQDRLSLKAFGLLNTRLPGGQRGFSLLIVISSEFTPIELGLGFKLAGVGGLLGLNRTVKVERLVSGLRDHTLNSILFPTDVVANADRILSDLRQVFPPQAGRFVFGPMARITWGTPVLLTADVGLVLEVPDPVRLAILGVVRAVLPDDQAAILRLQVNFLGVIDFEQERFAFDAALFDSKLLAFNLTGDMAVRVYWGAEANLLLTVGGFHPAYQPPPMNLPALRRLTLSLLDGDNPRLRLETYFAVTSNTVQFGARLELYAAAGKFNVYGFLSFDVLFQFNPFYFVADITAMLALRVGSSSIASIKLALTLEGPTPWKAKGSASLHLFWFLTIKVRFSKTFGETRNTSLPDLTLLPLVVAALAANDNWQAELPAERHRLESLREAPAVSPDQLLAHPAGVLKVSQKVVPLNVRIDRVGSQRPSDAREFRIADVHLGPSTTIPDPAPAQESFAPAQFFDLTDEEKLASPSFKSFDSGVRLGEPDRVHTAYAAAREVKYELKVIDSQRNQRMAPRGGLADLDPLAFRAWALQGATAQSPLSFARRRKSSLAPPEVGLAQEPFAIVHTRDLALFDAGSVLGTERAALTRLTTLVEADPALRGRLQVVPVAELNP